MVSNKKKSTQSTLLEGVGRNVFLVGLVSLLTDLSSQMVFPLVPLFMASVLMAPAFAVGLVEGAAESIAALMKVVSGYWSDRVGRRKPFILFGYGLSGFAKPLFALATAWPLLLLFRSVERIGKGIRNAPRDALVAESSSEAHLGKAFGFQRALDGVGSVLGTLIGVALLTQLPGELDDVYQTIFLLSALPAVLAIFAILLIREPGERISSPPPPVKLSWQALPGNLKLFMVVSSLFAMGHFGYAFLLLRAKDIGLADAEALLLYAAFYFVYALASTPLGILSDRIGRRRILQGGYVLFALLSVALVFADTTISLLSAFLVYGLFFAIIDGGQKAYVVDLAPAHLKATALGAFYMSIGLFAMPGGLAMGLIWDAFGPEATFMTAAVLTVAALGLLTRVQTPQAGAAG